MTRVDQLSTSEGGRLRSIRLRALLEAPDAFATTFEQASMYSDAEWSNQLADIPTFVAVEDGSDVGLVRCARDRTSSEAAWLISMWVAPETRRARIGSALVDRVVAWALANGIRRLLVDVADANTAAIALYDLKGFKPTGQVGTLPLPRQHITEHQRELVLNP